MEILFGEAGASVPFCRVPQDDLRIAELQADLDAWVRAYNEGRPHQGRWCFGKTPMQTFLDAVPLAREKLIAP